jgi:thermostable 8-oxoguanine DNA glycosylase
MEITKQFVDRWAEAYDQQQKSKYRAAELEIIRELSTLPEPKSLNRDQFLRICLWKTPRPRRFYESNSGEEIMRVTREACAATDDLEKLRLLLRLKGVSVAVGSTLLHFLEPDRFAIFDVRARSTLSRAGLWRRSDSDASPGAWVDYVRLTRALAADIGVSLRKLDKALWAYNWAA